MSDVLESLPARPLTEEEARRLTESNTDDRGMIPASYTGIPAPNPEGAAMFVSALYVKNGEAFTLIGFSDHDGGWRVAERWGYEPLGEEIEAATQRFLKAHSSEGSVVESSSDLFDDVPEGRDE